MPAAAYIYLQERRQWGVRYVHTTNMAQSQHLHCNSHSSDRVIILSSNSIRSLADYSPP